MKKGLLPLMLMLLPGESKTVTIETSVRDIPAGGRFVLSGWNVESKDM